MTEIKQLFSKGIIKNTMNIILSSTTILYFIGYWIYQYNVLIYDVIYWVKDPLLFYETYLLLPILITWLITIFLQNAKSLYKIK